jgi:hypothetical protein
MLEMKRGEFMTNLFETHYEEKKALLQRFIKSKGNEKEMKRIKQDYFLYLSRKKGTLKR